MPGSVEGTNRLFQGHEQVSLFYWDRQSCCLCDRDKQEGNLGNAFPQKVTVNGLEKLPISR